MVLSAKAKAALSAVPQVTNSDDFENVGTLGDVLGAIPNVAFCSAIRRKDGKNPYISLYDTNKSHIRSLSFSKKLTALHEDEAYESFEDLIAAPVYMTTGDDDTVYFTIGTTGTAPDDLEAIDFKGLNIAFDAKNSKKVRA